MESQALAEELICGTVYYGEVELHSGEMVSKALKVRTEGSDNSSITSFGRPSKKSSSVVRQHAKDNRDDYPLAVAIILSQMYMDDIMTSLETDD